MTTVMHTSYRESGAANLLSYIGKEEGQGLENRYGQEMSDAEIQAFVDKSERHQFERDLIISPENGNDLTDDEMSLYTRQTMSEWTDDRPTADYCYSVHRDGGGHDHVHVALTGEKQDLYMDKSDIDHVRERTHETYVEQHAERTPTLAPEHEYEQQQQQQRTPELDHEREDDRDHEQEFTR